MTRFFVLTASVIASASVACDASMAVAQTNPRGMILQSLPDTSAWRPLLDFVVTRLTQRLADSTADNRTNPWQLTLPSTLPRGVANQLRIALRARDVTAQDAAYDVLELGPMDLAGDTARIRFVTGRTQRCPGTEQTTGYSNHEVVYVTRVIIAGVPSWSSAMAVDGVHGDGLPCQLRRDLR
ncbi:MAG: hypothetical protein ACREMA_06650 [Longimicrobiales bacterium]